MDIWNVLGMLLLFAVVVGPALWWSRRCPGCGRFVTRRPTGESRPEGGFFEPAESEWKCPHCGHRSWKRA